MHGVLADTAGGAWTFGGSILTFAFPMILFTVVAIALYVLYTMPEYVPGHRPPASARSVSYTSVPGTPATGAGAPAPPADAASPTRVEMAGHASEAPRTEAPRTEAPATEASSTEDAE